MFYFQADLGDPNRLFFSRNRIAASEVFNEGDDPQEGGKPGGFWGFFLSRELEIQRNQPFLIELSTGWCFFLNFPYIGNFMIPTDELHVIFQRGQPPTSLNWWYPSLGGISTWWPYGWWPCDHLSYFDVFVIFSGWSWWWNSNLCCFFLDFYWWNHHWAPAPGMLLCCWRGPGVSGVLVDVVKIFCIPDHGGPWVSTKVTGWGPQDIVPLTYQWLNYGLW